MFVKKKGWLFTVLLFKPLLTQRKKPTVSRLLQVIPHLMRNPVIIIFSGFSMSRRPAGVYPAPYPHISIASIYLLVPDMSRLKT